MGTTRWYQERKADSYHRRAKKDGYRARSAYKLQQIDKRFHLFRPGMAVADLGAAPGGWTQVLVEAVGEKGFVVGLDLRRIRPIPGARLMMGDFTKEATHERLAEVLRTADRETLDVVVSDMAPDMSGNYDVDQARSVQLCEMALKAARRHLKEDGAFVCKVFEGADFQELREDIRQAFYKVSTFHPPASRKASSEVYVVAKGHRRPGSAPALDADRDEPKADV